MSLLISSSTISLPLLLKFLESVFLLSLSSLDALSSSNAIVVDRFYSVVIRIFLLLRAKKFPAHKIMSLVSSVNTCCPKSTHLLDTCLKISARVMSKLKYSDDAGLIILDILEVAFFFMFFF